MQCHTTVGAARALQISQPAVSSSIRQLESQLGFLLFDRAGNRLVARDEARILFHESESIFLLSQALAQTAEDLKEDRLGHVRVVATPQLGHTVLPQAIQHLLQQRPKVKVFFDVRRSYTVIEKIESGSADVGLAIALEAELSHSLEMIPVATVEMVCLVRSDHPLSAHTVLTPSDLSSYALIGLEMGSRLSPLIRTAFKAEGVSYRTAVEVRYSETACLLVNAGVGITVVDWFSAIAHVRQHPGLRLIPFRPVIQVDASAVFSKSRRPSRLSYALIDTTQHAGVFATAWR
ncbi:MAG: LysR family transcriptional regulator [Burkholderiaceae bacterium]|nr:LysR family transcriptional regulator [Burkholderiaceae bacterium]